MRRQPPTTKEFENWILPEEALGPSPDRVEGFEQRRILMEMLKAGRITAACCDAQVGSQGIYSPGISLIERIAWISTNEQEEDLFWKSGHLVVERGGPTGYGDGFVERFFDVRFDPDELAGKGPKVIPPAQDRMPEQSQEPESEPPEPERTRHIGTGEMRKFAKLYLEIWGDAAKKIPAWRAMKACYPDGIIGRDPFLKEFRELRGPGKRGNPAIRDQ